MKPILSNDLVFKNLDLIFHAKDQCLDESRFVDLKGKVLSEYSELKDYLICHDLIEIEDEDHIYYLTTLGYDVQERGFWYDYTLDEDYLDEEDSRERWFYVHPAEEADREERNVKMTKRVSVFFVGLLVSGYSVFFSNGMIGPVKKELPPIDMDRVRHVLDTSGAFYFSVGYTE